MTPLIIIAAAVSLQLRDAAFFQHYTNTSVVVPPEPPAPFSMTQIPLAHASYICQRDEICVGQGFGAGTSTNWAVVHGGTNVSFYPLDGTTIKMFTYYYPSNQLYYIGTDNGYVLKVDPASRVLLSTIDVSDGPVWTIECATNGLLYAVARLNQFSGNYFLYEINPNTEAVTSVANLGSATQWGSIGYYPNQDRFVFNHNGAGDLGYFTVNSATYNGEGYVNAGPNSYAGARISGYDKIRDKIWLADITNPKKLELHDLNSFNASVPITYIDTTNLFTTWWRVYLDIDNDRHFAQAQTNDGSYYTYYFDIANLTTTNVTRTWHSEVGLPDNADCQWIRPCGDYYVMTFFNDTNSLYETWALHKSAFGITESSDCTAGEIAGPGDFYNTNFLAYALNNNSGNYVYASWDPADNDANTTHSSTPLPNFFYTGENPPDRGVWPTNTTVSWTNLLGFNGGTIEGHDYNAQLIGVRYWNVSNAWTWFTNSPAARVWSSIETSTNDLWYTNYVQFMPDYLANATNEVTIQQVYDMRVIQVVYSVDGITNSLYAEPNYDPQADETTPFDQGVGQDHMYHNSALWYGYDFEIRHDNAIYGKNGSDPLGVYNWVGIAVGGEPDLTGETATVTLGGINGWQFGNWDP